MTAEEMMARAVERTGESQEVLTSYIEEAGQAILNHVYPFRDDIDTVPERYHNRQLEIVVYLANKQGAEGETKHDENGTNRTYESGSIPESMFEGLVPCCFVPVTEDEEDENP